MSHIKDKQCLGCVACTRLGVVDEHQVHLVHLLTVNFLELQQLCYAAEQVGFDLLTNENQDVVEQIIAEAVGDRPPSTTTHH